MSSYARRLASRVQDEAAGLRDQQLLEGAMAAGALVAMADRRILIEEDLALTAVVENMEALQMVEPERALRLYTGFVQRIREDWETGRRLALAAVARCADDLEAAHLLVEVGIAVAKADQDFSREERDAIQAICTGLGIEGLDLAALGASSSPSAPGRRPH